MYIYQYIYTGDPSFYFTPHHETLAQANWHCPPPPNEPTPEVQDQTASQQFFHSNCNADGVHARMDWTSFTLGPSQGAHPVTLNYVGLDPEVLYELSVLFFSSDFKVSTFGAELGVLSNKWSQAV
eukprot:COSAG02_NODE_4188_length_5646_cov_5.157202_2_plen_125_part_00